MSLKDELKTQRTIANTYVKRYIVPHAFMYQKYLAGKMINLVKPKGLILDNGCGPGFFCKYFLKDYDVVGIDVSEDMLVHARENLKKVVQGNAESLPFPDNNFNTVFARSLIHHLENPQRGVNEIFRVLKNNGRVLFADTFCTPVSYIPRKILSLTSFFSKDHKNLKEGELVNLIKDSGLKIEKIEYCDYLGYAFLSAPDIFNPLKFMPFKISWAKALISFDKFLSKAPLLNKWLASGIIIVAYKSY